MATCNGDLASLLVGHMRRTVKCGEAQRVAPKCTVSGLLRGALHKYAQEIVTNRVLPRGYVAPAEKARQERVQKAQQAQRERMAGWTGNKAYDALPDVAERRRRLKADQAWARQAANNPEIVKRKDLATVMREGGAKGGVSNWGDSTAGKVVGGALGAPVKGLTDTIASTLTWFTHAPKGTSFSDWQKQYWQTAAQGYGDFAGDVANNFHLQANNARHGAASLARTAGRYLDTRTYGNSTKARNLRESYANTQANAALAHADRERRILGHFNDRDLRNPEKSTLGMLNYGANAGVGQFAGQSLALAGAGTAAKGVGQGITKGTHAMSNAIRGSSAAGTAGSKVPSLGSRIVAGSRNALANGVDAIGDTVSLPFRAAGTLADPVGAVTKGVTKGVPAVTRGVYDTVRPGLGRPMREMYRFARHPLGYARDVVSHPWRTTVGVARWGKDTAAPAWRAMTSKPALEAQTMYSAARSAAGGRYGDAAGEIGTMGVYGAAGNYALPALLLQSMYSARNDGNNQE